MFELVALLSLIVLCSCVVAQDVSNVLELIPADSRRLQACTNLLDICLVADISSSIDDTEYAFQTNFYQSIVDQYMVGPDKVRFAYIEYSGGPNANFISSTTRLSFPDGGISNTASKAAIGQGRSNRGSTYTFAGLDACRVQFTTYPRANAKRVIILGTDGEAEAPVKPCGDCGVIAASAASTAEIIVAIGIGNMVTTATLQNIVSGATISQQIFQSDFADLLSQVGMITNDVCTTEAPTSAPTSSPTSIPTANPSASPSTVPSPSPSSIPSAMPSAAPSSTPTENPSALPSATPSSTPTAKPSASPSKAPSALPSAIPSLRPSVEPTAVATGSPIANPSAKPSASPSSRPSAASSAPPTSKPTARPTSKPTSRPTSAPTNGMTCRPGTVFVGGECIPDCTGYNQLYHQTFVLPNVPTFCFDERIDHLQSDYTLVTKTKQFFKMYFDIAGKPFKARAFNRYPQLTKYYSSTNGQEFSNNCVSYYFHAGGGNEAQLQGRQSRNGDCANFEIEDNLDGKYVRMIGNTQLTSDLDPNTTHNVDMCVVFKMKKDCSKL